MCHGDDARFARCWLRYSSASSFDIGCVETDLATPRPGQLQRFPAGPHSTQRGLRDSPRRNEGRRAGKGAAERLVWWSGIGWSACAGTSASVRVRMLTGERLPRECLHRCQLGENGEQR